MSNHRAKRTEIWVRDTNRSYDLVVFKFMLEAFGGLARKIACDLKTVGRRMKRIEMWDTATLVRHIRDTSDLVAYKVILGHLVHLSQYGLQLENGCP